ncbi:EF-hand domain-containing protein [Marimonas sp. MJW-29]|uniref:EF-hand domain-containing protein n=1 Tax=Sulfitobacter sediminis TaxID=3234186 RepID=A0ABV3RH49_9RHOB
MSILALIALVDPVLAQQGAGDTPVVEGRRTLPEMTRDVIQHIRRNPAQTLQMTLREFAQYAPEGVLTRDSLQQRHAAQVANQRASLMAQYLRFDLDGDAAISADEFTRHLASSSASECAILLTKRFEADADKDGALSSMEIETVVQVWLEKNTSRRLGGEHLLQYDLDRDGRVTESEIVETIEAILREAPEPSTKRPDPASQRSAHLETKRIALQEAGLPELCRYPPTSAKAELRVLGAVRGGGLSDVAIAGTHQSTTVARLHIEKGQAPLYIILGAEVPVIWQISGATDRVERLVTHGSNAVTGLPKERVHFARSGICAPGPSALGKPRAREILGNVLQVAFEDSRLKPQQRERMDSHMFPSLQTKIGSADLVGVDEPVVIRESYYRRKENGGLTEITKHEAARMQLVYKLSQSYPLGVVRIDPEALVSDGDAERYALLPAEAGLLQMMDRGELRGDDLSRLVITRPIDALPSGLRKSTNNRMGQVFYVDPGVELDLSRGNLKWFNYWDAVDNGCVQGVPCYILPSLK